MIVWLFSCALSLFHTFDLDEWVTGTPISVCYEDAADSHALLAVHGTLCTPNPHDCIAITTHELVASCVPAAHRHAVLTECLETQGISEVHYLPLAADSTLLPRQLQHAISVINKEAAAGSAVKSVLLQMLKAWQLRDQASGVSGGDEDGPQYVHRFASGVQRWLAVCSGAE